MPIQRLSAGGAGGITSVGGVTSRGTERVSGAATVTGTVIGSAAAAAVFSGLGAAALDGATLVRRRLERRWPGSLVLERTIVCSRLTRTRRRLRMGP